MFDALVVVRLTCVAVVGGGTRRLSWFLNGQTGGRRGGCTLVVGGFSCRALSLRSGDAVVARPKSSGLLLLLKKKSILLLVGYARDRSGCRSRLAVVVVVVHVAACQLRAAPPWQDGRDMLVSGEDGSQQRVWPRLVSRTGWSMAAQAVVVGEAMGQDGTEAVANRSGAAVVYSQGEPGREEWVLSRAWCQAWCGRPHEPPRWPRCGC
ncbi:hypothetical protein M409DRAFT_59537 [Zasmidium cellare ATCC 36951]|uniref:Uncharacterized protein n=1 Tax=Zasmidium cellare ATCC 36951 TaxID=1080233 RepID=A0A6A6C1T4_ZASCE|nr:uncharacterized protein M409DRAFT_59537 [Zasmidium cellare ATCC 36951]KAF2161017.1 hypothetical protein M409DRAFT_59537 [Zasmidium cellare ATCC 36951]